RYSQFSVLHPEGVGDLYREVAGEGICGMGTHDVMDPDRPLLPEVSPPGPIDEEVMKADARLPAPGPDGAPRALLAVAVAGLEVVGEPLERTLLHEAQAAGGDAFRIPGGAPEAGNKGVVVDGES